MTGTPTAKARVREAVATDAPALARLHAQCFSHSWPESDFGEHIVRDLVLVVEGRPASIALSIDAFIAVRRGGGQAEILTLATAPTARRRGLARTLVEAALARLGHGPLFLEVAEDNAPAIALYRSLGFQSFGRRPAYYRRAGGRVAALLMERRVG